MDDKPERTGGSFVLRFGRSQIVLGNKVWLVLALLAAIVVVGILISPGHAWVGVGVAASGIFGAILGSMFQLTPLPVDYTANGASAVRGLLEVARDVQNVRVQASDLAEIAQPERVQFGMIDVQERLGYVVESLYVSMSEWESIAPGSRDEVLRLKNEGREAFKLLNEEGSDV